MFINNMEEFEAHYEEVANKVKSVSGSEHFNKYACRAGVAVEIVENLFSEIAIRDAVINQLKQDRAELRESLLALDQRIREQGL